MVEHSLSAADFGVPEEKTPEGTSPTVNEFGVPAALQQDIETPGAQAPITSISGEQQVIDTQADTPQRREHFLQSVSSDNPFDPVKEFRLFKRQDEINKMPVRNPLEFLESLGARIKFDLGGDAATQPEGASMITPNTIPLQRKLAKALFPLYNGVRAGEYGWFDMLDRAADFIAEKTGFPKGGLFEKLKYEVQPYARPETIAGKVMQDLSAAPFEIAKFIVGKGAGGIAAKKTLTMLPSLSKYATLVKGTSQTVGVGSMGALEHLGDGPMEVAKGAAYFMIVDRIFMAVGGMPRADRMVTMGGIFGGLTAVSGGDNDEIISSVITGTVMGSMGGKGRDELSYSNIIRERIQKSEMFKKSVAKSIAKKEKRIEDANTIVFETKDIALDYLRKNYPETYDRVMAEGIGEIKVRFDKPIDLVTEVNKSFDQMLGLTGDAAKIPLRQKLEMAFKKADPHGNVPADVRIPILEAFETNINRLGAELAKKEQPNIKAEGVDTAARRKKETDKFDRILEKTERDKKALREKGKKSLKDTLVEGFLDTSGRLKARILETTGEVGKRVVAFHDLIAGAPMRTQLWYGEAEKKIYKGVERDDLPILNAIIFGRGIKQIDARKAPKDRPVHPGGTSGRGAELWMQSLQTKIGDAKFRELNGRADEWFATMRQQLTLLQKNKIISKGLYKELLKFDWTPREFLNKIDPLVEGRDLEGGKPISVRDSGIATLGRGSRQSLNIDSQELLAQVISRNISRIARNNANKAAYDLAKTVPDNPFFRIPKNLEKLKVTKQGIVKGAKTPKAFDRLNVWIDGVRVPLFISKQYSGQWITNNPQISREIAEMLRTISGSWFIRPLATGYNPGFAISNFARDFFHIWLASGEFSPALPLYAGQMARNLAVTMKDAWLRKGVYKDFINDGGGMAFLTHQGRDFLIPDPSSMKAKLHPKLAGLKQVLGYLNETSEIWMRLALRDQALRNGKDRDMATWESRNYLDFSQGGKYSKTVDHFIPYFNASVQAMRGIGRAAKNDPVRFAAQILQIQLIEAGLWAANRFTNPEVLAQISEQEQSTSFVITTNIGFYDEALGANRYVYFSVKKDNTVIPFTSLARWGLSQYVDGRLPDKDVWRNVGRTLKNSIPVTPGDIGIPSINASLAFFHNYDLWSMRPVWWKSPVRSEEEYYKFPNNPTPEFWKDTAGQVGLSPERTKVAISKLLPNNSFTDIVGAGFQSMLAPNAQQAIVMDRMNFWKWLAAAPIAKRVVKITHPYANEADRLADAGKGVNTVTVQQNRKFDELFFMNRMRRLDGGDDTIKTWLRSLPKFDQGRIEQRWVASKVINRLFGDGKRPLPMYTSRRWWLNLKRLDPEARAELFYEKWVEGDATERNSMRRLAGGLGFYDDRNGEFATVFQKMRSQRGN